MSLTGVIGRWVRGTPDDVAFDEHLVESRALDV